MANEINGLNSNKTQTNSDRHVQSVKRNSAETSDTTTSSTLNPSDKVSLTDTASKLKALEKQLASEPEVDLRRVSDVSSALNKGEYKVNPDRVAGKMMDFEASF